MTKLFKKHPDISNTVEKNNDNTAIIFNMDKNYNIDIQFYWPDINKLSHTNAKEIAKNYASLISIINLGGFKNDILKILLESQQTSEDSIDKKFLQQILEYLIELEQIKISISDNPIIMPSKAFTKKI